MSCTKILFKSCASSSMHGPLNSLALPNCLLSSKQCEISPLTPPKGIVNRPTITWVAISIKHSKLNKTSIVHLLTTQWHFHMRHTLIVYVSVPKMLLDQAQVLPRVSFCLATFQKKPFHRPKFWFKILYFENHVITHHVQQILNNYYSYIIAIGIFERQNES